MRRRGEEEKEGKLGREKMDYKKRRRRDNREGGEKGEGGRKMLSFVEQDTCVHV